MALSDNERAVLANFVTEKGVLWDAWQKFCDLRARQADSSASSELRQRHVEQACDYAVKADVYGALLEDLKSFVSSP